MTSIQAMVWVFKKVICRKGKVAPGGGRPGSAAVGAVEALNPQGRDEGMR